MFRLKRWRSFGKKVQQLYTEFNFLVDSNSFGSIEEMVAGGGIEPPTLGL